MKRFIGLVLLAVILISFPPPAAEALPAPNFVLRIGLNTSAMGAPVRIASANLLNHTGSGYEFGYIDGNMNFISQGSTAETAITMRPSTGSTGGITVVVTGTNNALFRFDESSLHLAVRPVAPEGVKAQTWHRSRRYFGMFEFRRTGNEILVISVVNMQDYIKGVIPYEMSPSWPIEALKAQTVSARTFAAGGLNRHRTHGYSICDTTHCQVYRGTGSATAHTDRAVDETFGMYITHNSRLITTSSYHSSNGGATEDVENVWVSALPYLRGVVDIYEDAARIPGYRWTYSVTNAQISAYLTQRGVANSGVSDLFIDRTTRMGNALSVTVVGTDGRVIRRYERSDARTFIGGLLRFSNTVPSGYNFSPRYTIAAPGSHHLTAVTTGGVNATQNNVASLFAIDGRGRTVPLDPAQSVRLIGSGGTLNNLPRRTDPVTPGTYIISGHGHGHNVGMSQWGARSMADLGYSYEQILKFYYTAVEITRSP
jgi:stage II sporulation protein D